MAIWKWKPRSTTVTTALLTVTANNLNKTYGVATPPLTFTTNGLVNNDTVANVLTCSLTTTATALTPAGSMVPINQGTPAANANDSGPVFHGLFRTSDRREAVAPVVSELWGSHAVSAPSPARTFPDEENPAKSGGILGLFRDSG